MANKTIALGALNLALVVILGAFGAHALKAYFDSYASGIYQIAIQYHGLHALGLLLIGINAPQAGKYTAAVMQLGIILFCGSLYALALTGIKALGMITPVGGVAFIISWLLLAYNNWRA